jgi:hypothetical protein
MVIGAIAPDKLKGEPFRELYQTPGKPQVRENGTRFAITYAKSAAVGDR